MTRGNLNPIPQELRDLSQWVCHREGEKVPIDPKTGRNAKANDPATWGTFEQATEWAATNGGGIGFEFTEGTPFCGIDLDHVIGEDGNLTQDARECVGLLDTYTEVSPSGTGLHLIARARKPEGGSRRGVFEMYDHGRYFRMTGDVFEGHGTINDRQEAVNKAHARWVADRGPNATPAPRDGDALEWDGLPVVAGGPARGTAGTDVMERMRRGPNWPAISRLLDGDTSIYPSHSEADMALCNHLAYYCDRDEAAMDEMFRRSGLMRPKWDETRDGEHTYGWLTIHDAAETCRECYTERHAKNEKAADAATKGEWRSLMGWIDNDVPEDPELIAGLLRRGEKSILYGASKAGKSWLSMHLAASLAAGLPFLGHECVAGPVRVWYLNLEINDNMFRRRMRGVWRTRGIEPEAQERFMWMPRSEAVISAADAESAADNLLRVVEAGDFVVLDCLYMMLNGGDENSAQTMQPMMRQFDRLLTEGKCSGVWLVHHQAKGAAGQKSVIDRGAGSGVSSRFVDNVFSLDHLDADPDSEFVSQANAQKLYPRRLSCVMRNAEDDGDVDFLFGGPRLVPVTGGDLAAFYVKGSPQANGARNKGQRERANGVWERKNGLIEAALRCAEFEEEAPTFQYVSAYYHTHMREYGLPSVSEGTLANWLKPSNVAVRYRQEEGKVVRADDGPDGDDEGEEGGVRTITA